MKLNVIAYTQQEKESKNELLKEEFLNSSTKGLIGRFANVCYMKGNMETVLNQSEEKAIKRAEKCSDNYHLSVFEHCSVTVALEGVPKIIAMILNSFRLYSTSEKSGRYTSMKGLERRDQNLYEKWIRKLSPIIAEKDPSLTSIEVNKLAKENARYFISVFSLSTDLIYTTNIRQWGYIYGNLIEYYNMLVRNESYYFELNYHYYKKLFNCLSELIDLIEVKILKKFQVDLYDWKERIYPMNFIDYLGLYTEEDSFKEFVGYNFSLKTNMSFVALAQKERSRVIKTCFSIPKEFKFFIPLFIEDNKELKQEWQEDMRSIIDLVPQATIVEVVEHGLTEDFLKYQLTERICSRAQYETFSIVYEQAKKIIQAILQNENISKNFKNWVRNNFVDRKGDVKTKCAFESCEEPCGKVCKNRIM